MDAVITYVNGLDPEWQESFRTSIGGSSKGKQYRDWGTLRYLLRGIERHLPFVRNVYLVVSGESQVPEWVDRENLKVVFHRDIIPERFLPVFNSASIEIFLHRIPGLDREFIYFNDDIFPLRDCRPEDFFREGRAAAHFQRHLFASGMYKRHSRNGDRLAREAAGLGPSALFRRPQHACTALLREVFEEVWQLEAGRLEASVSPVRREDNVNFSVFADYAFYTGRTFPHRVSNRHFSTAVASMDRVCSFLDNPSSDFVCINDVDMSEDKYQLYRKRLLEAFERAFPEKSRFEL